MENIDQHTKQSNEYIHKKKKKLKVHERFYQYFKMSTKEL